MGPELAGALFNHVASIVGLTPFQLARIIGQARYTRAWQEGKRGMRVVQVARMTYLLMLVGKDSKYWTPQRIVAEVNGVDLDYHPHGVRLKRFALPTVVAATAPSSRSGQRSFTELRGMTRDQLRALPESDFRHLTPDQKDAIAIRFGIGGLGVVDTHPMYGYPRG